MGDHFSEQAALYATYRPAYPNDLYDFIFQHLSDRQYAWDCATGSGQVAQYLAEYFKQVDATDISRQQLDQAIEQENINYRKASAEDSGLPSNHYDLITVAQAIHWFDFNAFYEEVRRTAKNGGLLAVFGYGMISINPELDPIINNLYEEAFGNYFDKTRQFIDQEYQTIPFPFEEISAHKFENHYDWTIKELEGFFNSWSAIQKMKETQGHNPADATIERIRRIVSDESKLEVTFPVFLRLGRIKNHL